MTDEEIKKTLNGIKAYCARAERSPRKAIDWLKRREVPEELIGKMLSTLRRERFIDEERYARFYASDKKRFAKWGPIKIKYYLVNEGISPAIAEAAIKEVEEPEQDYEQLQYLLSKKIEQTKADTSYELTAKVARWAVGRGFEPDEVFPLIEKLLQQNGRNNE